MRVICAMSGGVDSSVAAALLQEAGHEVIGITLKVWPDREDVEDSPGRAGGKKTCCAPRDVDDARAVAAALGIPHYTLDVGAEFQRSVIDYFVGEYARGRTPHPCLACNRDLKFDYLLQRAEAVGAEAVATGHYARIERDGSGRPRLLRGSDAARDQTAVLWMLTPETLGRVRFPVGGLSKAEVRDEARRRALPVAEKPDSQEICFVPDGDWRAFLRSHGVASAPGPVVDTDGRVVGTHEGIPFYTVGQRRGLPHMNRTAPQFITAIDAARNTLTVGGTDDGFASGCLLERVNWIRPPACPPGRAPVRAEVKIRYRQPPSWAQVTPLPDGRVRLEFETPLKAVTPGQPSVFYDGDEVLGGGVIAEAIP